MCATQFKYLFTSLLLLHFMMATVGAFSLERGLVQTNLGTVHYVACGGADAALSSPSMLSGDGSGDLTPILAFHMSPRSSDEFREVMPLLSSSNGGGYEDSNKGGGVGIGGDGRRRLVVAIDELGYGRSDVPSRSCTIDEMADGAIAVADSLGIEKFIVVGSLVGNFFAVSLASRYPDRVSGAVLTNPYHWKMDAAAAAEGEAKEQEDGDVSGEGEDREKRGIHDPWEMKEDGAHIMDLWKKRSGWLDSHLNTRAVYDELTFLLNRKERFERGISIQDASSFNFERAAERTECPALLIKGAGATAFFDSIGYNMTGQFTRAVSCFPDAEVSDIEPGSICLINQDAALWARCVREFLDAKSL